MLWQHRRPPPLIPSVLYCIQYAYYKNWLLLLSTAGSETRIHKSESKSNPKHVTDIMQSVTRNEIENWNPNTVAIIFFPFCSNFVERKKVFCFVLPCWRSCDFHASLLERKFLPIGMQKWRFIFLIFGKIKGQTTLKTHMQLELCLSTGLIAWNDSSCQTVANTSK